MLDRVLDNLHDLVVGDGGLLVQYINRSTVGNGLEERGAALGKLLRSVGHVGSGGRKVSGRMRVVEGLLGDGGM